MTIAVKAFANGSQEEAKAVKKTKMPSRHAMPSDIERRVDVATPSASMTKF